MPPPGCRLPCLGQLRGVCPVAVPAALFAGTQITTMRCAPRGQVHARQARDLVTSWLPVLFRPCAAPAQGRQATPWLPGSPPS